MKKVFAVMISVSAVALIGVLLFQVVDSAISLAYCRQQNLNNRERCRLLARLAEVGLKGVKVEAIVETVGAGAVIELDEDILGIDDVTFRIKDGMILSVDLDHTCGS